MQEKRFFLIWRQLRKQPSGKLGKGNVDIFTWSYSMTKKAPCTLLLAVIFSVVFTSYGQCESLGNEIFTVAIPFAQEQFNKDQITQKMQRYRNVVLFEEQKSRVAAVGHYLRKQEATALLADLKPEYPEARIASLNNFATPGTVLPWLSRIQLNELGYQSDLISYGPHPYIAFSFPWTPGTQAENGRLLLHIRHTPLLQSFSSVHVKIAGISAGIYDITQNHDPLSISIPLAPFADFLDNNIHDGHLNVTVEGTLRLFDDSCKNQQANELWLAVDNDSLIETNHTSDTALLNRFLADSAPAVMVVADETNKDIWQGVLTTVAAAKAAVPSIKVSVAMSPAVNPFGHTIIVGAFDQDMVLEGSTLYLSPEGARALGNKVAGLLASPRAAVQTLEHTEWNQTGSPLAFSSLGFQTASVKGAGELVTQTYFTLPQLNGFPKSLTAVLHLTHTSIPPEDKGFLKIRLNGHMIASQRLSHKEKISPFFASFSLPVDKLTDMNRLEVVFAYYLNQGNCKGIPAEMEATLFDDSSLIIGSEDTGQDLRLNRVMGSMNGRGALVVPQMSYTAMRPLVEWASMYGELHRKIPVFTLVDKIPNAVQFDYFVLSVTDNPLPSEFTPLITTGEDIAVRNPLTGEIPFRVTAEAPVWITQTFRHQNVPALVFSCLAPDKAPMPTLDLKAMEQLGGNAAAGRDQYWQSMVIGKKLIASPPDQPDFTYYWNKYSLLATLALAGILVCFFYYVYTRLTGKRTK